MSNPIPVGWEKSSIGEITATNSLFSDGDWVESKDQDTAGTNRLIQLADIGDGKFVNKSSRFMNDEQFERLNCTELLKNDILIARMPDPLGRACLYPLEGKRAATVVDVAVIRTENADHYWLMSVINSSAFRYQIDLNASGTTRTRIARGTLSEIEILKPPLPEQQKIATILSSVDDVIEKTRTQIDKLKDLKTGMMQELLTKGIGHTEFKDSPVGRIPVEWDAARLSEVFTLNYGKSPKDIISDRGSNPVWGTGGKTAKTDAFLYDGESIVLGRKGTIDQPRYVSGKFWVIDTAYYSTKHDDNCVRFLHYLLQNINLKAFNEASGVPSLSRETLYSVAIALPPPLEQKKIADIVYSVERKILADENKYQALCKTKKALMQDLLTGKVRVKVDAQNSAE